MTDHTITTTVTFADLINSYDSELADLREAYDEVVEYATDEHGDDRPAWPDDLRQQARLYDEAAKSIQRRQNVLETLQDDYDDGRFEVKMLSGSELMDIETELRMEAASAGVDVNTLQARRQQLTVDAATVDAPDAVPRDDDDSPQPSECPNPLTLALHEQVERLNTAGAADFRAPGFADGTAGVAAASSASPTTSSALSSDLASESKPTEAASDSEPPGEG